MLDALVEAEGVCAAVSFEPYRIAKETKLRDLCAFINSQLKTIAIQDDDEIVLERIITKLQDIGQLTVVNFSANVGQLPPKRHKHFSSPFFEADYHHFQILEAHRLVEKLEYSPANWLHEPLLGLNYVRFTQLGFGVVRKLYTRKTTTGQTEA